MEGGGGLPRRRSLSLFCIQPEFFTSPLKKAVSRRAFIPARLWEWASDLCDMGGVNVSAPRRLSLPRQPFYSRGRPNRRSVLLVQRTHTEQDARARSLTPTHAHTHAREPVWMNRGPPSHARTQTIDLYHFKMVISNYADLEGLKIGSCCSKQL